MINRTTIRRWGYRSSLRAINKVSNLFRNQNSFTRWLQRRLPIRPFEISLMDIRKEDESGNATGIVTTTYLDKLGGKYRGASKLWVHEDAGEVAVRMFMAELAKRHEKETEYFYDSSAVRIRLRSGFKHDSDNIGEYALLRAVDPTDTWTNHLQSKGLLHPDATHYVLAYLPAEKRIKYVVGQFNFGQMTSSASLLRADYIK